MQLIKKIPFLLGWSIFYLSTLLPVWVLALWVFPYLRDLFPQLTPNVSFMLLMATYVVISFFTFTFSINKIALPLYRIGKIHNDERTRVKLGSYLPKWFLYLVYYVVYCVPLAIKGLLPPEIEGPIYMAWRILASFLAYRGVVHSWLDDVVLRGQQNSEEQAVTA